MPSAALRSCLEPGCPELVERGRCPKHSRAVEQRRGSQRERGYNRSWEKASRQFKNQFPLCGMRPGGRLPVMSRCHEQGLTTAATQTDHVIPHKGNVLLFWDWERNWQSLCATCGARKSQAGL